jgi:hypothetical protein
MLHLEMKAPETGEERSQPWVIPRVARVTMVTCLHNG